MLDKSQSAFQHAQSLKNKYLSTRSRAAFNQLEEAAANNYWAKRWLADIYRNGLPPTFNGIMNFLFLMGNKITAFNLYIDLTKPAQKDLYSDSSDGNDLAEVFNLTKEDLYAQFNAFRCEREAYRHNIDPPWYQFGTFGQKDRLDYEERTAFSAFYLALSQDIDARQGLSYLQTTSNLVSSSDVGKKTKFNTKVLAAFALKNDPVLQFLKRQSPKEFEEIIDTILKPERLSRIIEIANAQNDYRVLELIKEQNPVRYDDTITAMHSRREFSTLVQTLRANHVPIIRQDQRIKSEEDARSFYPKLAHHAPLTPEEKNADDFFKDFSAAMQLLRTNDLHKVPATGEPKIESKNLIELVELPPETAANPTLPEASNSSQQQQKPVDVKTDDEDLIRFEELSFPEVPAKEPTLSISRIGIKN